MKNQILAASTIVLAIGLGSTGAEARGFHHWGSHSSFAAGGHSHRHYAWSHRLRGRHAWRHTSHSHVARGASGDSGGMASWYGPGFSGHRTASGAVFRGGAFTAAHRSWPFGTRVRVTNQSNGRSVVVTINDRGPYVGGRVIDLSAASAHAIGMSGTARVTLARL